VATLILPNTIDPLTTADAAEVEQNYQVLRAFVNNDVVHRDGTKSMTGPLILANSSPADDLHAASRGYVDAFLPIGVIMPYGGVAAPAGGKWALCDGASKSTTGFPELFAVLGFRYGGSGGTFNLPNLKGKVPIGVDSGQTRFNATGKAGGSWLVPIPSHTHGIDHNHGSIASGNQSANHQHEHPHTHTINHDHAAATASGTTGSAGAHSHNAEYGAATSNPAGHHFLGDINDSTNTGVKSDALASEGAHTHSFSASVNLPTFSGVSGQPSDATTYSQNASHHHTVDMPNFVGTSKATSLAVTIDTDPATTSTTEHVAPYVVVNYIIRVS
jgi:microcystin-dependent protein